MFYRTLIATALLCGASLIAPQAARSQEIHVGQVLGVGRGNIRVYDPAYDGFVSFQTVPQTRVTVDGRPVQLPTLRRNYGVVVFVDWWNGQLVATEIQARSRPYYPY